MVSIDLKISVVRQLWAADITPLDDRFFREIDKRIIEPENNLNAAVQGITGPTRVRAEAVYTACENLFWEINRYHAINMWCRKNKGRTAADLCHVYPSVENDGTGFCKSLDEFNRKCVMLMAGPEGLIERSPEDTLSWNDLTPNEQYMSMIKHHIPIGPREEANFEAGRPRYE